jgi:hypothetical protein
VKGDFIRRVFGRPSPYRIPVPSYLAFGSACADEGGLLEIKSAPPSYSFREVTVDEGQWSDMNFREELCRHMTESAIIQFWKDIYPQAPDLHYRFSVVRQTRPALWAQSVTVRVEIHCEPLEIKEVELHA